MPEAHGVFSLRDDFAGLVSLLRDVDRLSADISACVTTVPSVNTAHRPAQIHADTALKATAARAEALVVRAAEIKHALSLPGRDLLRHFAAVIGVDQMFATSRDLSQTAAENLRRDQLAEQAKRAHASAEIIARIRGSLEWLEVFSLGVLAIVIADVIAWQLNLASSMRHALLLLPGPLVIGLAASILKPWKRKPEAAANATGASTLILVVVVVACVAAWLGGTFLGLGPINFSASSHRTNTCSEHTITPADTKFSWRQYGSVLNEAGQPAATVR